MALCLIGRNSETNYSIFAIDSTSDLSSLPTTKSKGTSGLSTCSQGSIARCSDGTKYVLKGDDTWVAYEESSGSSGGSSEVEAISDTFIDNLF